MIIWEMALMHLNLKYVHGAQMTAKVILLLMSLLIYVGRSWNNTSDTNRLGITQT